MANGDTRVCIAVFGPEAPPAGEKKFFCSKHSVHTRGEHTPAPHRTEFFGNETWSPIIDHTRTSHPSRGGVCLCRLSGRVMSPWNLWTFLWVFEMAPHDQKPCCCWRCRLAVVCAVYEKIAEKMLIIRGNVAKTALRRFHGFRATQINV